MHKLDKTDLRILSSLLEDSRTSYAALARETNLTIPSIKTRIEKYSETGLIEKFTINLDTHMIMRGTSMSFLFKVKPSDLDRIAKDIYESPFIANMTITSGHYNLLIVTHPMSDKDKLEFIRQINSLPGDSVMELVSSINLETFMCKPIELPKTPINLLIRCDSCQREFSGEVFSKAILGRKRYFCSPVCQDKYEERAKKYIRGELFRHPDEETNDTTQE
ncbi:MAG: winged helix-turn-helix transcriptional regulator [Candidatus Heimdallarchaeota archaeon]|nr:winged helix-turn-helix transcriptional regulator [Candidatus Heimdallarchaeota archaeon]